MIRSLTFPSPTGIESCRFLQDSNPSRIEDSICPSLLYTFAIIIHILLDASVFTSYPVKDIAVSILANDLLDLTLDINFTHI